MPLHEQCLLPNVASSLHIKCHYSTVPNATKLMLAIMEEQEKVIDLHRNVISTSPITSSIVHQSVAVANPSLGYFILKAIHLRTPPGRLVPTNLLYCYHFSCL